MTDDIVDRLRTEAFFDDDLCSEAANEIERLRAALTKIATHDMQAIAMDALRPNERLRAALSPQGDANA